MSFLSTWNWPLALLAVVLGVVLIFGIAWLATSSRTAGIAPQESSSDQEPAYGWRIDKSHSDLPSPRPHNDHPTIQKRK